LIAVDVGNSKTLVVVLRGGRERARWRVEDAPLAPARRRHALRAVAAELAAQARDLRVVLASVAPRRAVLLAAELRRAGFARLHSVTWRDRWPFAIDLRHPESVGADRLANVAGLVALGARSGLAIDAGTAITIDVLRDRRMAGGLIVPGFDLSLAALHRHTERLPHLVLRGPTPLVGRETTGAMRAGVYHATRHGVAGVVAALASQPGRGPHRVVVTGGAGLDLLPLLPAGACYERDLLVLGLRTVAEARWGR
jgi:type III pantothenate kinase